MPFVSNRTGSLCLLILVVCLAAQNATAVIWVLNPANGRSYAETPVLADWHSGEAMAQSYGGHLATVRSQEENDWLHVNFPDNLWIGLTDENSEGNWQWSSGEPVTFLNWGSTEPNGGTNANHAVINWHPNGQWNDWGNNSTIRALMEIPEPGVLHLLVATAAGAILRRRR